MESSKFSLKKYANPSGLKKYEKWAIHAFLTLLTALSAWTVHTVQSLSTDMSSVKTAIFYLSHGQTIDGFASNDDLSDK